MSLQPLVPEVVKRSDELISRLGLWCRPGWAPFHDGEVIEIKVLRDAPSLVVRIFTFHRSDEFDELGQFLRKNEVVVTLEFDQIDDLQLSGFNHQNVIGGIFFEQRERITIFIESIFGVECRFTCKTIKVINVAPGKPSADETVPARS
jgi:hypothetical protein